MQQPVQVEGPGAVAGHVGVAEHEVHIVDRVDTAEQAAQQGQPAGYLGLHGRASVGGCSAGPRPGDQQGNLGRVELFAGLKLTMRVAAHASQQRPELFADDPGADRLVSFAQAGQEMLVEEMSKRTMPHVVQ